MLVPTTKCSSYLREIPKEYELKISGYTEYGDLLTVDKKYYQFVNLYYGEKVINGISSMYIVYTPKLKFKIRFLNEKIPMEIKVEV